MTNANPAKAYPPDPTVGSILRNQDAANNSLWAIVHRLHDVEQALGTRAAQPATVASKNDVSETSIIGDPFLQAYQTVTGETSVILGDLMRSLDRLEGAMGIENYNERQAAVVGLPASHKLAAEAR